jgi:UTP--glucose-1-phosphate uridylyltransferase
MSHIKTAIFPVAGMGTRFLPITKTVAKEMLPLIDKPLIQYAVEEALAAGIEQLIFVSSPEKVALEEYFKTNIKLEQHLFAKKKPDLLSAVQSATLTADQHHFVYQTVALGLGHAILQAKELIGDEPFAVILPDDFVHAETPCLQQMISDHAKSGGNMVATMDVGLNAISAYGCLDVIGQQGRRLRASGMVEKPKAADAPSTQAVIGRYILQPSVMKKLETTVKGAGGEIQLTDAIAADTVTTPLYGYQFEGTRYDCGSKAGFLEATVAVALSHPTLSKGFQNTLTSFANIRAAA